MDRELSKSKVGRLFGAIATLGIVAGCANIIGLSDIENDDKGGAGGGIIPQGGKGGMGGGTGGTAGKGGSGGGTGGSTGGGGTGGSAGSTSMNGLACDGTPIDVNEDLLTACVMLESCSFAQRGISYCLSVDTPDMFEAFACAKTASTCDEIFACENAAYQYPGSPADCPGTDGAAGAGGASSPNTACVGNYAVNCDPLVYAPTPFLLDCTARGGTCNLQPDGYADCQVNVPIDCSLLPDGTNGCSGTYYYECYGGLPYGQDCTASAGFCDIDPMSGDAGCYYNLTACGGDSATCSNDVGTECSGGSRFVKTCSEANLTCSAEGVQDYCLASGCTSADWNACQESCNGTQLTFCYGGAPYTIDCTDYGFDLCHLDDVGYSGRGTQTTVAVCGFSN